MGNTRTVLTQIEAGDYGDPALKHNRPTIWINEIPHIVRGVQSISKIGDVLLLAVKGRHGSRILISHPDSLDVSEKLRKGDMSVDLGNMREA